MKSFCPEMEHYSPLANILAAEENKLLFTLLVLRFTNVLAGVPCSKSLISLLLLCFQNQV